MRAWQIVELWLQLPWKDLLPTDLHEVANGVNSLRRNSFNLGKLGSINQKYRSMRLCKTEPPCESHSVEQIFSQLFEKVLALCLVCGQIKDTQLAGSLIKLKHNCFFFIFCVRILLVYKKITNFLVFLTPNFDPQRCEFPMVFKFL